jgi:RNA-directed DNA polymerase
MQGKNAENISTMLNDCPQRARTESEWYEGVQTYIWMTEDNIVEVPFDKEHLLEVYPCPLQNLEPQPISSVVRNKGCGGVDKMSCEQLLPWLRSQWKDTLIGSLMDGSYRPNPVRAGRDTQGQWQEAAFGNTRPW